MAYNPNIDHLGILADVRAKWDSMNPGPARAWTVINEACLRFQSLGEDAGLLAKDIGTNYLGYSIDVIGYRSGTTPAYDALHDADGAATPQWAYIGEMDVSRWRPPIGDVPQPPDPPDPPDPPHPGVCPCPQEFAEVKALIADLREEVQTNRELFTKGLWEITTKSWSGTAKGTATFRFPGT